MTAVALETSRRRPGMSLPRQYAIVGMLLIAPTVLIFALVIVYPLLSAIYLSLLLDLHADAEGRMGRARQLLRSCCVRRILAARCARRHLDGRHADAADRLRRRHGAAAQPQHLLPLARPQPGALPLLRLDRRRRAGLALAVQRLSTASSTALLMVSGLVRHAARLARLDAERDDQRHPGRRLEVFPLRRHRRAGAAADASRAALRGGADRRRRRVGALLGRHPAAASRRADRHRAAAHDLGLQGIRPDLPADRRRAGRPRPQTLPLLVYKQAFGLNADGHGLGLRRRR